MPVYIRKINVAGQTLQFGSIKFFEIWYSSFFEIWWPTTKDKIAGF